jgi:hypothetical protein
MLLTGRGDATRAVVPVAEGLLNQMIVFGRLASAGALDQEQLASFAADVGFTVSLLDALHSSTELRFAGSARVPYCYNSRKWPPAVGPSGYLADAWPDLAPADVAWSLFLNWNLAATDSVLLLARILRCGLWQLNQRGVAAAVDLIVDLYEAGYADAGATYKVCDLMIRAGAVHDDLAQLTAAFFGGALPATPEDFVRAELVFDWLAEVEDTDSELGRSILEALVVRTGRSIDAARATSTIGQWFTAQVQIGELLGFVLRLQAIYVPHPGPAMQILAGQWDEIRADAVGFQIACRAGLAFPDWAYLRSFVDAVRASYTSNLSTEGESRLCAERLVVPTEVREQMLRDEGPGEAPPRWLSPEPSEILPWTLLFRPGENASLFSPTARTSVSSDDVLAELETFHRQAIVPARQVAGARRLCDRYPYLAAAHQELGIALAEAGDSESGIDELTTALVLAPMESIVWHSLAVALDHGGYGEEAHVANAVTQWILVHSHERSDKPT